MRCVYRCVADKSSTKIHLDRFQKIQRFRKEISISSKSSLSLFIGCDSPALQKLGVGELNEILNFTWAFVQVAAIILTMGCNKEYLMRVKFLEERSVDAKFTLGICVQEFIQRVASFELPHIFLCMCSSFRSQGYIKSYSSFDKFKLIQASCHSIFFLSFFFSENKHTNENKSRKWREGGREKQIDHIWGLYPFPQFSL